MAKIKFGTYAIEVSVTIEDEIDLEDHFTKEEWEAMKAIKQKEWLEGYCESLAIPDLEMKWKLNK
jgi:hypothetical protein